MNTSPEWSRRYDSLVGSVSPLCIDVFRAYDRVLAALRASFPGAMYVQEVLMLREWAELASVPASALQDFKFSGHMCEEDARRVLITAEAMVDRIGAVKYGALPKPKWSEGLRNLSV